MVCIELSPEKVKTKLQELGLQGVNAVATHANCPFCSRGHIKFHGAYWYTNCCRMHGSLVDLAKKLKQLPTQAAEQFVQDCAVNRNGLRDFLSLNSASIAMESLWKASRTLTSVANLTSFQQQIKLGGLEFSNYRSQHGTNLDQLVRVLTAVDFKLWKKDGPAWLGNLCSELADKTITFVLPGYVVPGVVASLTFLRYSQSGSVESFVVTAPDSDDAGFVMHPSTAISESPTVLTSDLSLFLRLTLWHADQASSHSPITFMRSSGSPTTKDLFLLVGRRGKLYWGSDVSEQVSKNCHDLNCPVTSYGVHGSAIRKRDLVSIRPDALYECLSKRSCTVVDYLRDKVKGKSVDEVADVLSMSFIPPSDLEVILVDCPSGVRESISVGRRDTCPVMQTTVLGGSLLEQRPDGWYLLKSKQAENICSHPFRIKYVYADGKNVAVEVYHASQWIEITVPINSFDTNAFEAVRTVCRQLNIGYFTFDTAYEKQSANWCARLNPTQNAPVATHKLSVDIPRRQICTNNLIIRSYPVAMDVVTPVSARGGKFLHLADGSLPDIASLADICKHKSTYRCISALTLQLLRNFNGEKPYAITYGEKLGPFFKDLLDNLAITQETWPCCLTNVDKLLRVHEFTKNAMSTEFGFWSPIKSSLLYWLSVTRPLLYLGHTLTSQVGAKQKQLHRTVVCLIRESLKISELNPLKSETEVVVDAWKALITACNHVAGTKLQLPLERLSPTLAADSVSFWLRRGIATGQLVVKQRSGKGKNEIVLSGTKVTFKRSLINSVLESARLPTWCLPSLTLQLQQGPGFISIDENYGQSMLTMHDNVLGIRNFMKGSGVAEAS